MDNSKIKGRGLERLVFSATILGTLILSIALAGFLGSYSQVVTDRALDRAVQVRARTAGLDLARSIDAEWRELVFLGQQLPSLAPEELQGILDGFVGSGNRVAWVGYAGLDGRVIAASGEMLVGTDVSERPWFRGGLNGNYAGDVRDAVLLNKMLGGTEDDPIRFIDLVVPINDAGGTVTGVLAMHMNAEWLVRFVSESAKIRELDLFLVNPAGEIVVSSTEAPTQPSDLQTFRAAAAGIQTTVRETWPDGKAYQSSILPTVTYGSIPSFGWRLVARIQADAFAADRSDLLQVGAMLMVGCFALILLFALVFVRLFIRPVSRLADASLRISAGEMIYPPESTSSREARAISVSLARLQSQVRDRAKR